jgi:nicotinate-nucleotide adenylyltransferase
MALARHAIDRLALDELRIIPSGQAWYKKTSPINRMHRLAMVELCFRDWPKVVVDDREIRREGPSYTIDSLRELGTAFPHVNWFLIIGEDQAQSFETWREWTGIVQMAQLVVAKRSVQDASQPDVAGWHNQATQTAVDLDFPMMDISATSIRAALAQHQPVSQWLSPAVIDYIHRHNLYSTT